MSFWRSIESELGVTMSSLGGEWWFQHVILPSCLLPGKSTIFIIYIWFFPLKPQFIGDFQLPCLTARGYPVRCQLLTSDCWNHQARSYNFQTGDVLVQGSKSLEASMILLASGSSAQKFCSVEIHSVQCVSIQIKDWIVSTFECSIHMYTPQNGCVGKMMNQWISLYH